MFGYRLHPTASTIVASLPLIAAIVFTFGISAYKAAPTVSPLTLQADIFSSANFGAKADKVGLFRWETGTSDRD